MIQELTGTTPQANLLPGLNLDEVFARTEGGNTRYYLTDALNSTLALTDAAGNLTTQYTFEPFGNTTQTGAANSNSYQYTGRENDGTGLMYYRARYYSPTTQRFISQDPIGFDGDDVNLYAYVGNNPIKYIDPLGLLETIPPIDPNSPSLDPKNPPVPQPPSGTPGQQQPQTPPKGPPKGGSSCRDVFKFCMGACTARCPGTPIVKGGICGSICGAMYLSCVINKANSPEGPDDYYGGD